MQTKAKLCIKAEMISNRMFYSSVGKNQNKTAHALHISHALHIKKMEERMVVNCYMTTNKSSTFAWVKTLDFSNHPLHKNDYYNLMASGATMPSFRYFPRQIYASVYSTVHSLRCRLGVQANPLLKFQGQYSYIAARVFGILTN